MNEEIATPKAEENAVSTARGESYNIRVIEEIHDPDLIHHWKRIEEEADVFPQMYYEWCEPWWRLRSGKRKLHIVAVEDASGKIVGIAPLCIEKRFGFHILRSFPIHFGDYYSPLIADSSRQTTILEELVSYVQTFAKWNLLLFANVNTTSAFFETLSAAGCPRIKLSDIFVADFDHLTFDGFLSRMSSKRRHRYRYALRQLEKKGNATLEVVEDAAGYFSYLEDMKRLYRQRWAEDHSLPPDESSYECRNEAIEPCFDKKKAILFVLKLNERVIAFRLGFNVNGVFHEWRISHDPVYDRCSPGTAALGKVIEALISRAYRQLDFMPGEYPYKRWWAPDGAASANYSFLNCDRSFRARTYLKYRLEWRDTLRSKYYAALEVRWIRAVKRWLETLRRRFRS